IQFHMLYIIKSCLEYNNSDVVKTIIYNHVGYFGLFNIPHFEPTLKRVEIVENILTNFRDKVIIDERAEPSKIDNIRYVSCEKVIVDDLLHDPVYYEIIKKHGKTSQIDNIRYIIKNVINKNRDNDKAKIPILLDLLKLRPADKAKIINSIIVNTKNYYEQENLVWHDSISSSHKWANTKYTILLLDAIPGDFRDMNLDDVFDIQNVSDKTHLYYENAELWKYLIKRGVDVHAVFPDGTNIWYQLQMLKSYRMGFDSYKDMQCIEDRIADVEQHGVKHIMQSKNGSKYDYAGKCEYQKYETEKSNYRKYEA
ncbi:MAG: hypothetical protein Faunusvirus2_67, partial [Faunusvirus sp.]